MSRHQFRKGIFVGYSHRDKPWLDRLKVHLSPYLENEKLTLWDDSKIVPGSNWEDEIGKAISRARVAVLLVTADFLASKYVVDVEIPAILNQAENDLTILWVPISHAAFDRPPLVSIQAAYDPSVPISTLDTPQQEQAFSEIARRIIAAGDVNAVANALKIIDDFEPQMNDYIKDLPEPSFPVAHSIRAEQSKDSINLIDSGGARTLITADELEKLDPDAKKLIRSYERTMKVLFERWTELKPKLYSEDYEIKREAREESVDITRDLCRELGGLLSFIESTGKQLMDHYVHVRHICNNS